MCSLKSLTLALVLTLSACSPSALVQETLVTGAGGAVLGAGSGALIGSAIGGEAGVGAAIGAGAGLIAGAAYGAYQNHERIQQEIDANYSMIRQNHHEILKTQDEIDSHRSELVEEIDQAFPDREQAEYQYLGHSLGNVYR